MRYYRGLLAQAGRIEVMRRAIAATVTPDDVVLEVGGGLGTFAFFAADAGARRVVSIEGDPVVHVARAVARQEGYGGRVEFIRGWVPEVELDEPATVIVFEDYSPRLFDERVCEVLAAVRSRYAAPDARWIPHAARIGMAPVQSATLWAKVVNVLGDGDRAYGLDWSASRSYVMNAPHHVDTPVEAVLGAPAFGPVIDVASPVRTEDMAVTGTWSFADARTVHGLVYWFDLAVGAEDWLSNAPGGMPGSWGHHLLPCDPPLRVGAGETLTARVWTDPLPDGVPAWLGWEVAAGDRRVRGHEFAGQPASLADLEGRTAAAVPTLGPAGRFQRDVLALVDGVRSVDAIAQCVAADHQLTLEAARRLVRRVLDDKITLNGTARPDRRSHGHRKPS